ncbi:MAG: ADP-glyceromanno-heptose 6-epimerase [Rhabdochlamydiaceae bacterium]|nr:ADP-glyceromanno-heptose 6-epimerase [Candidatus Amphrikana amoebophyrae]
MSSHKTTLFEDKLIVVTGAAGFIGSGVVRHLNEMGYKNLVLVDDFKSTQKWKNLVGKDFFEMVSRYDLFDWLEGKERDIAAFIHLGACSDTVETDGDYFMETNYRYSIELAQYALANDHRFIYASSAATYGDGALGFVDDHDRLSTLKPLNMYGFSKHLFDLWAKNEGVLDQIVGLKYFNVFGPNETHKGRMASMVMHMKKAIDTEGVVKLFASNDPENYKDGEQVRDFIYVKDAVKVTCSFLVNDLAGIYNVGTSRPSSWNELATNVFEALGQTPNIQYVPMPVDLSKQYQNYTCADLSKFESNLQKSDLPKIQYHTLKAAVTDYIQNYLIDDNRW